MLKIYFFIYCKIGEEENEHECVLAQFSIENLVFDSNSSQEIEEIEPTKKRILKRTEGKHISVSGSRGTGSVYAGSRRLLLFDMEGEEQEEEQEENNEEENDDIEMKQQQNSSSNTNTPQKPQDSKSEQTTPMKT